MLTRLFGLSELGTDVKTEVLAGLTTFMTMCYILVVNPTILAAAGLPFDGVLFATAIASASATLVMGLWARYPIALAPGMGLNAYFASVIPALSATLGSTEAGWRAALGAVFLSGLLFLLLTFFKAREALVNAIPETLKLAISAGIGLFIAFIGFKKGAVVVDHEVTLVQLGNLAQLEPLLTLGGLFLTASLMLRGIKGAILWGMIAVTVIAMACGRAELPNAVVALPAPESTAFRLDLVGTFRAGLFNVVLVFCFVDLFDTLGTLIGIAEQGNFFDDRGHLPRASRALFADAIGTMVGALLGTSTVTSYVESAAGISVGGRSGLTAVVTAGLFSLAIFFAPLFRAVPDVATAPVLIAVGVLMTASLRRIAWDDLAEGLPALLTVGGISFTFSIANGMALGFVSYALVRAAAGRAREVGLINWTIAALFVLRFALLRSGA